MIPSLLTPSRVDPEDPGPQVIPQRKHRLGDEHGPRHHHDDAQEHHQAKSRLTAVSLGKERLRRSVLGTRFKGGAPFLPAVGPPDTGGLRFGRRPHEKPPAPHVAWARRHIFVGLTARTSENPAKANFGECVFPKVG